MRKFSLKLVISEYFGIFVLIFLTYYTAKLIVEINSLSYINFIVIYLVLYFVSYFILARMYSVIFRLATNKHYLIASIINIMFFWFDIYFSFNMLQILVIFITKMNYNLLEKYFDDKHLVLSYASLALCMLCYDKEPVNKWFYDNYISKSLPVDSNYYPLYKYLSDPALKDEI